MSFHDILADVGRYYSDKVRTFGPTAKGADWNSPESQELRFEQLLKVCDLAKPFSMNDYGCGYGALAEYMTRKGCTFRYCGFDISADMLSKAIELQRGRSGCTFVREDSGLTVMDYTVASGIFNVRLGIGDSEWQDYVTHALGRLSELSEKGFAFNMLTKYSDPERMRPDLYYADPCRVFDQCKTRFSKQVALLHDYGLYEFTVIVRK
jgi:SAM-dependent methyltransferase